MRKSLFVSTSIAAVFALSGAAFAQTSATATTDLNIRSGPGPSHQVVGVIGADESVTIEGCLEGSLWCRVTYDGTEGWAYAQYLTADLGGTRVVVSERRADVGVPVEVYEADRTGTTVGAAGGAIAGALIGGPIGAVAGGLIGASAGGMIDPPANVRSYVRSNPVEPVYLEGEVVVGAGLPETVELRQVPDYEYRYVYVNEVPVLVEPDTRRIVYVIR